MITDEYITQRYGKLPQNNIHVIRETMQRYGDNHWWESKDPAELARYQTFEKILLIPMGLFHEGLRMLGINDETADIALNSNLEREVRLAMEGTPLKMRPNAKETTAQRVSAYLKSQGVKARIIDLTVSEQDRIDRSGYDGWLQQ